MSRAIMFVALLTVLTLRFVDGVAHLHVHDRQLPAESVVLVLDHDADCGNDDFHAAAHCASHMADTLQRSAPDAALHGEIAASPPPAAWSLLHDGRSLSPPVRPPLA